MVVVEANGDSRANINGTYMHHHSKKQQVVASVAAAAAQFT